MANGRSNAWVFPVIILAVPSVMFYVWWSHLNAEQRRQMTQKIRRRTPEVFSTAPAGTQLTNPIADQQSGQPGTAPMPPVVPVAMAAGGSPPSQPPQAAAGAAVGQPGAAAPASTVPIEQQLAAPAPPAGGTSQPPQEAAGTAPGQQPGQQEPGQTAANQVPAVLPITRDPTMSPYDIVRMEQARLEAELREREEEEQRKRILNKRNPPIESFIDLQGIVGTPDSGNKAIINGEVMSEGETIKGARILRITSQGVVLLYKGRKVTKTINK